MSDWCLCVILLLPLAFRAHQRGRDGVWWILLIEVVLLAVFVLARRWPMSKNEP